MIGHLHKRLFVSITASLLVATSLSGVGVLGAEGDDAGLDGVELNIWRKHYDQPGSDEIDKAFQAETGASIDVKKVPASALKNLLPLWSAGERPDVLIIEGYLTSLVKLGTANLHPLDGLPAAEQLAPEHSQFGTLDGVRYWLPQTAPTNNSLLYNKEVIAELGLDLPGTFEELIAFCEVAKDTTIPVVIGEKSNFMAWMTLAAMSSDFHLENPDFKADLLARTASFTDPEYVKRIQSIIDIKEAGCFRDNAEAIDLTGAMNSFMAGEGAIFNCGNNCVSALVGASDQASVDAKVGFLPISYTKPVVWTNQDGFGYYLPRTGNAEREAAARAYVEFATGPGYEIYLDTQAVPSAYLHHSPPDPAAVAVPILESFQAAIDYPVVPGYEPLIPCGYGDLKPALQEMFIGEKTALQVAEGMDLGFEQSCKDLGYPGF